MHRFTIASGLSLALLSATPAFAQMITLAPEQVGQVFCIARLGNDMAAVEGLLTPELSAAIAAAETKNEAIQKQYPDDKPPLGDGIPWQAFPDYAAECAVGDVTLSSDEASVAISYGFPEYPADADFTDTLKLKLVEGTASEKVWRIDNIVYANQGDLRSILIDVFTS